MPNPNPPRRISSRPESLPSGMDRMPDGRIRYRWSEHGTRHKPVYGWTTDECMRKRYEPVEPAPIVVDESTTLAEYLRLWVAGLALRPNTVANHRDQVERYLVPLFGERIRLVELTREEIKLRYAELRDYRGRGGRLLAPRTVAMAHATLRRALFQAVDDRRIEFNPAARVNPHGRTGSAARGRRVGVEIEIPSDDELRRVETVLAGGPLHTMFVLSTLTGLRQSEALALDWESGIDLDGRWVHVHRALRRTDRTMDDPKTPASNRYVPFNPMLVGILKSHRRAQAVARLAAGDRWQDADLVFADELGRPLIGSTLSHRFAAACRAAGVREYRWHDLRHVYASGLINAGVPIAIVSKRLGHASVTITSEIYHHLIKSDELDTAEIAGRVFAQ